MIEGDEWKFEIEEIKKKNPDNILLEKYRIFLSRLSRRILKPALNRRELLNKRKIKYLKKNLDKTLTENLNKNTPDKTEDAYWTLRNVLEELSQTPYEELEKERRILSGLYNLSLSCNMHSNSLQKTYSKRNPCRESQNFLKKKIEISSRNNKESPLIKVIENFHDICNNCPYK